MSDLIIIKNVRCSFAALFEKPVINGKVDKYGIKLLLHPQENADAINMLWGHINNILTSKSFQLGEDQICLRDGNKGRRPEHHGYWVLTAKSNDMPVVIASNGQTRITDKGMSQIYSGCRVNAKIDIWPQDNEFGRRINATLVAVQFERDDTPLTNHITEAEAMAGFSASTGAPGMQQPGFPQQQPGFPQQQPGFPQQQPGFPQQQPGFPQQQPGFPQQQPGFPQQQPGAGGVYAPGTPPGLPPNLDNIPF